MELTQPHTTSPHAGITGTNIYRLIGEVLDLGFIVVDIANGDPRFEFYEEDQDAALNETVNNQVKEIKVVIIPHSPDPTVATTSTAEESLKIPDTKAKLAGVLDYDKAT